MTTRIRRLAVLALLTACLAGCSKDKGTPSGGTTGAASGTPSGTTSAAAGEHVVGAGSSEVRVNFDASTLPPEFPPDLPLYPGAEVRLIGGSQRSALIGLVTRDGADAVLAFYRSRPDYEERSFLEAEGKPVLSLRHKPSGKAIQVVLWGSGEPGSFHLVAPR